jgi:hypothetical protein
MPQKYKFYSHTVFSLTGLQKLYESQFYLREVLVSHSSVDGESRSLGHEAISIGE